MRVDSFEYFCEKLQPLNLDGYKMSVLNNYSRWCDHGLKQDLYMHYVEIDQMLRYFNNDLSDFAFCAIIELLKDYNYKKDHGVCGVSIEQLQQSIAIIKLEDK